MKKLGLSFALIGFAGLAAAQDPKPIDPLTHAPKDHATPVAKTHDVEAEVVSYDASKKMLTIKGTPDNKTLSVDAKAVASAADLKAGDMVTLTCRDNEKGEHLGVSGVKRMGKMTDPDKK